ncbi:MAG: Do family serine endopeptidase [Thermoguttaceae bacterium]|jgi:serine protease Do
MTKKCLGFRTRTWVAGIGLLVVLSTLAAAGTALSYFGSKDNAIRGAAWYAEATPPSASNAATSHAGAATEAAGSATGAAKAMSKAFHEAAMKVLPSVVMITNIPAAGSSEHQQPPADRNSEEMPFGFKGTPFGDLFKNPEFHQFFKQFPSMPMPDMPRHGMTATGSGVIVDPSGVVLTNNHVVAGGGQVMVRLLDGREFKAVDIKTDPETDLAVLRIEGAGPLTAARLGDSNKLDVGDWVLALGQPFGLEGTVTAGIVSAKGRGLGITDRENFIQTDAAINPGNSGGPLVNLDGEVVGINTAISTSSGGYQGVGFAIPVDLAKWVGGQLVENGKVHRAFLGVVIQPVTQPLARQFKVNVHQGVLVTEVRPDTPAAKAGLKTGDIILQFAGQPVSNPRELQGIVERAKIGGAQPLLVLRDGRQMTLNVTCRELPADLAMAGPASHRPAGAETSHFDKLGIQVENLTPEIAEQLGVKIDHGVAITDVRSGSPAELAGLAAGMVITEANHQPLRTVEDLRKALEGRPLDKGVLLLVRSSEGSRFVVLQTESK